MAILYTSQIFGGTGIVSVSTFGNLPSNGKKDQRIVITGESSLFDSSYPVTVYWDDTNEEWLLENARATYINLSTAEFNSGIWTGTGKSIGTKPDAIITDTTYGENWRWKNSNSIFTPVNLNVTTVGNQQKIKGDSTTLESGWVTQLDATCTLTVDGGNKLFATAYGNSSAPTSRYSRVYFTDTAGSGTTNNFYMKCLLQRTTMTMGTTGGVNLYIRHDTGNGGRIVEFGDGSQTAGSITINGKFMDRTTGWGTTYTATANRGDTWTSETLVQFRVIAGAVAQIKIGTGGWHDIAVSTCRSSTATLRFEIGVAGSNNALNIAAMKFRYLQAIRYT